MPCMKTGAVVALPEWSTKVVGDLYKVGNCIVFQFDPETFYRESRREATHSIFVGSQFNMVSRGVMVVTEDRLKTLNPNG